MALRLWRRGLKINHGGLEEPEPSPCGTNSSNPLSSSEESRTEPSAARQGPANVHPYATGQLPTRGPHASSGKRGSKRTGRLAAAAATPVPGRSSALRVGDRGRAIIGKPLNEPSRIQATAEQRGWVEAMIGYACRKPKFVCRSNTHRPADAPQGFRREDCLRDLGRR